MKRRYRCVADDEEVCKELGLEYYGDSLIGKDCPDFKSDICICKGICMFKFPIREDKR